MNFHIGKPWWSAFAAITLIASSYAAEESAVQEVRKDIEELGLTEEFNPATEEIVGVGSVFASVEGWEEKYVEAVTTARSKAAMEVSKVLSANLSAARSAESASCGNSRYKVTARVIKMRTEGNPVGCRLIARRQKVIQGKIQVAVGLKWSVRLEAEAVGSLIHPQAVGEEEEMGGNGPRGRILCQWSARAFGLTEKENLVSWALARQKSGARGLLRLRMQ